MCGVELLRSTHQFRDQHDRGRNAIEKASVDFLIGDRPARNPYRIDDRGRRARLQSRGGTVSGARSDLFPLRIRGPAGSPSPRGVIAPTAAGKRDRRSRKLWGRRKELENRHILPRDPRRLSGRSCNSRDVFLAHLVDRGNVGRRRTSCRRLKPCFPRRLLLKAHSVGLFSIWRDNGRALPSPSTWRCRTGPPWLSHGRWRLPTGRRSCDDPAAQRGGGGRRPALVVPAAYIWRD